MMQCSDGFYSLIMNSQDQDQGLCLMYRMGSNAENGLLIFRVDHAFYEFGRCC